MISRKLFWSIITLYLLLGTYFFFASFQSPIIGIEVTKKDNLNVLSEFAFPELAKQHNIHEGDILLEINNQDVNESPKLEQDNVISTAHSITILTRKGEIRHITFIHKDLTPFHTYFLIPLTYLIVSLILAIYLFVNKKGSNYSLTYLILVILTSAIAYGSISAATGKDRLGLIINSTSMVLTTVFLLYFLKYYFNYLSINWRIFNHIKWFYLAPIITFLLTIIEAFIPVIYHYNTMIILLLFSILLIIDLVIIIIAYLKYPKSQMKLLLWGIILPFMPFLFLYVLPMIFFKDCILSPSLCALFLMFIPFGFIFAQYSERLYDMEYYISRLRFYSTYSFIMTFILSSIIYFITSVSFSRLMVLSLIIFILLVISLEVKEKFGYLNRKVVFSPRGNYIHLLYSTIEKIGKTVNTQELFTRLSSILSKQLEINDVYIVSYDIQQKQLVKPLDETKKIHTPLDYSIIENLGVREIKKLHSCYIACIHEDIELKQILIIGNSSKILLKEEELLWLELLILYISNFIDNTKLVEELLDKLKAMQQSGNYKPLWLQKLIWLKLEEEKNHLAQELHDTVLQDQIFLIREMDTNLEESDIENLQENIFQYHQQLVSINHQLRAYCEILKPPLLDTLGLNAALNRLFMQTKKRADFTLIYSIEQINSKDHQIPLLIYRIIQEMLSNAIKHSQATYVKIDLKNNNNGIELTYMDNGIGFDMKLLNKMDSMGLTGMRERVLAFNGHFKIDTYPNEGMQIEIQVRSV